jgi:hypothetical protein
MAQTTVEHNISERLDQLVNTLALYPPETQLQTAAALLDHATDLSVLSKNEPNIIKAASRLFYDFAHLPAPAQPGFRALLESSAITQLLVGHPAPVRAQILLRSLRVFLTVLEMDATSATEALFVAIVQEEAKTAPVARKSSLYAEPPELLQDATVLRTFKPAPAKDTIGPVYPISVVCELPNKAGLGPELYGLAYTVADSCHVLLSTGEYLKFPVNSIQLAVLPPAAWNSLPPYLLACGALFFPKLLPALSSPDNIEASYFGEFAKPVVLKHATASALSALAAVLDYTPMGPTGPIAANTEFEFTIDATQHRMSLGAQYCSARCRIASMLSIVGAGTDRVVMRLPPREMSVAGVYLFPLANAVFGLTVL